MLASLKDVGRRYLYEGYTYRAAALAYETLLSLVPILLVVLRVLSVFPAFEGMGSRLESLVINNFVATSAETIQQYLHNFSTHINVLPWPSTVFLVFVALLMVVNIHKTFNEIWQAKRRMRFSFSFLVYLLVLLLSPILLGGVLMSAAFLEKLPYVSQIMRLGTVQQSLFFLLPYVIVFVVFTGLNWLLPSCRVRLWDAVRGGLATTVLFEIAKVGFTLYLAHFPTYHLLYGALAVIPLFLVWLYVSWSIILLGALLTNRLSAVR